MKFSRYDYYLFIFALILLSVALHQIEDLQELHILTNVRLGVLSQHDVSNFFSL
jgi:hypothetical protein